MQARSAARVIGAAGRIRAAGRAPAAGRLSQVSLHLACSSPSMTCAYLRIAVQQSRAEWGMTKRSFSQRITIGNQYVCRLDTMPGAVLATSGAAGARGLPSALAASPGIALAASPTEAAAQPVDDGISVRTWQTLREALAHAAEGRILTAAELLGPAAAASGLSEAALLARLQQTCPAGSAQHADGSAAQGIAAVEQAGGASSQPFHAVAAAARGSASAAGGDGQGPRQESGPLSAKEAARVVALPEQAAWLREGLRQFHDREGYAMARDDDLKVSYRHLKGARADSPYGFPPDASHLCCWLIACINQHASID